MDTPEPQLPRPMRLNHHVRFADFVPKVLIQQDLRQVQVCL
ncbi:hypothetical protein [Lampropedia aestuarii]|nr:hypothetical protein [Lampropedia aestuarii]